MSGRLVNETIQVGNISLANQTIGLADTVTSDFAAAVCDGLFVSSSKSTGLPLYCAAAAMKLASTNAQDFSLVHKHDNDALWTSAIMHSKSHHGIQYAVFED